MRSLRINLLPVSCLHCHNERDHQRRPGIVAIVTGSRTSVPLGLVQDSLDHLVTNPDRLRKPRREVCLDLLEAVAIGGEVAECDTVGPTLYKDLMLAKWQANGSRWCRSVFQSAIIRG